VDARNHVARGMIFGIAANGGADAEKNGEFALGNRVDGVIGALRVDVGLKFAKQLVDVELVDPSVLIARKEARHG